MSLILALDSSSDACSVALNDNGKLTSLFEHAAKSHTQRLLPMVDEVLTTTGYQLSDLDAIAFGRGPGSFTGLRICLGIVQGLAFGANLPVIPVSTLESMAYAWFAGQGSSSAGKPLLVALDARMNEVYWSLYQYKAGSCEPQALVPEAVMSPADVVQQVQALNLAALSAIGPGWHYPELAVLPADNPLLTCLPDAAAMAVLAAEKFRRGEQLPVMEAEPVYLRNEVSWQKRQRIRQ